MSGVLNLSGSSCSDISQLELSLEEAEEKIAGLLRVKEKLVQVQVYLTLLSYFTKQFNSCIEG